MRVLKASVRALLTDRRREACDETQKTYVTGRAGEAPLKGDTIQINVSDIWRPEEGAIFSRSAAPRSTEIPNLSATNDSARQQLRSGSQKKRRPPPLFFFSAARRTNG